MKIPGAVKGMFLMAAFALTALPMAAQQEVDPDHYDTLPPVQVVQKHKPAMKAAKPVKPAANQVVAKAKPHKLAKGQKA